MDNGSSDGSDEDAVFSELIAAREKVAALTPRQQEMLAAMALGEPIEATAQRLNIRVRTVKMYRGQVFSRLGIHGMANAVRIALLAGLLDH